MDRRLSKSNRGGKFAQSTLYTYMEISQWNPFVKLIYSNLKNYFLWRTQIFRVRRACELLLMQICLLSRTLRFLDESGSELIAQVSYQPILILTLVWLFEETKQVWMQRFRHFFVSIGKYSFRLNFCQKDNF
jgi:hypothetical protein